MEKRHTVHGETGDTVEEVSEGEVDNEDGGVLERGPVEAEDPVGLGPGDGQQSQEVTQSSKHRHNDTSRSLSKSLK